MAEVIGSIISIFALQTFLTRYKPFYPRKKFYIFRLWFVPYRKLDIDLFGAAPTLETEHKDTRPDEVEEK